MKALVKILLMTAPALFGQAPSWFVNMKDNTWATPVTNTLDAVKPNPLPPANSGFRAICDAWTGGTADQDSGELILAANGGHLDYSGNEVYACALRKESPAWVRLTDPSNTSGGDLTTASYGDGKPRAVHGWNRCTWGNGKVWYAGMDGMYSGGGNWSLACYSFNRSARQWTYHGIPNNNTGGSFSWQGGMAAYDRVGKRVWSCAGYAQQDGGYSVDATNGAFTKYNWYLPGNFGGGWSAVIHDGNPRVWVITNRSDNNLWILNLENVAAGWTPKSTGGSPSALSTGIGAVYHAPTRAIYCWNGYGASLRKLSVPANPLTGSYTWSEVTPAAGNSVTPGAAAQWGTYGKFNMIEDMGNGQSALCLVNSVTGPVYVYKLPGTTTAPERTFPASGTAAVAANPNPASAHGAMIQFSGTERGVPLRGLIYNSKGQVIDRFGGNEFHWETRHLPSGLYFLSARAGGMEFSKRLLIQK